VEERREVQRWEGEELGRSRDEKDDTRGWKDENYTDVKWN